MNALDLARLLAALASTLVVAHALAFAAVRLGQPAVLGEIVAGVVLGPSVLGLLAPATAAWMFPASGPAHLGLGLASLAGQLLLMFLAGTELRVRIDRRERRTGIAVALAGLVPFGAGLALGGALPGPFAGPAGTRLTIALVVALALAIAAIPVIARIMTDLGLTGTPFSRVVLGVAVVEDVVLYVVLAALLGVAGAGDDGAGLRVALGLTGVVPAAVFCAVATAGLFAVALGPGGRWFRRLAGWRGNVVARQSPVAFRLAVLCGTVLGCVALGVNEVFGALAAGICVARGDRVEDPPDGGTRRAGAFPVAGYGPAGGTVPPAPVPSLPDMTLPDMTLPGATAAWRSIHGVASAVFVPVFFASVGMQVDLATSFDPLFLAWFLLLACGVKMVSVWGAARLAGESPAFARSLAVALNARGTPAVVLASLTLEAGLIDRRFFVVLVLVALLSCLLAANRLGRRRAHLVTPGTPAEPVAAGDRG